MHNHSHPLSLASEGVEQTVSDVTVISETEDKLLTSIV